MGIVSRLFRRRRTVLHYTGHRILSDRKASRFPAKREAELARLLGRLVRQERIVAGYGGLASGADILFAEALMASGGEVHIILACDAERFLAFSVAEAGEAWIRRFHAILAQATSVSFAQGGDAAHVDFGAATDLALDLGEAAAVRTGSGKLQIAIFDGRKEADSSATAGTGPDMERGAQRGWRQIVLNPAVRWRLKARHL
jgi:hypothetical protein